MIELTDTETRVTLEPNIGGVITSFHIAGKDIFRPAPNDAEIKKDPRLAAHFPCVPWFGRLLPNFVFNGQTHHLSPTVKRCDPIHPIHGEGWINSWRITEQSINSVTMEFDYVPAPTKFPFSFRAIQQIDVSNGACSISLTLENTASHPIPAGLGLHPFFQRTPETALTLPAEKLWTPPQGSQKGAVGEVPAHLIFDGTKLLPTQTIDHTFIECPGEAKIAKENIVIKFRSDTSLLHFFAPAGEPYFCLEPVTQLPGKFGERLIDPAEKTSLSLSVSAELQ